MAAEYDTVLEDAEFVASTQSVASVSCTLSNLKILLVEISESNMNQETQNDQKEIRKGSIGEETQIHQPMIHHKDITQKELLATTEEPIYHQDSQAVTTSDLHTPSSPDLHTATTSDLDTLSSSSDLQTALSPDPYILTPIPQKSIFTDPIQFFNTSKLKKPDEKELQDYPPIAKKEEETQEPSDTLNKETSPTTNSPSSTMNKEVSPQKEEKERSTQSGTLTQSVSSASFKPAPSTDHTLTSSLSTSPLSSSARAQLNDGLIPITISHNKEGIIKQTDAKLNLIYGPGTYDKKNEIEQIQKLNFTLSTSAASVAPEQEKKVVSMISYFEKAALNFRHMYHLI